MTKIIIKHEGNTNFNHQRLHLTIKKQKINETIMSLPLTNSNEYKLTIAS